MRKFVSWNRTRNISPKKILFTTITFGSLTLSLSLSFFHPLTLYVPHSGIPCFDSVKRIRMRYICNCTEWALVNIDNMSSIRIYYCKVTTVWTVWCCLNGLVCSIMFHLRVQHAYSYSTNHILVWFQCVFSATTIETIWLPKIHLVLTLSFAHTVSMSMCATHLYRTLSLWYKIRCSVSFALCKCIWQHKWMVGKRLKASCLEPSKTYSNANVLVYRISLNMGRNVIK